MELIGLVHLRKIEKKKLGDKKLRKNIEKLISLIKSAEWKTPLEIKDSGIDADCVHSDGFYFFNITGNYRTLILIEFVDQEASIIWAGDHDKYERTFNNNKNDIKRWLTNQGYI